MPVDLQPVVEAALVVQPDDRLAQVRLDPREVVVSLLELLLRVAEDVLHVGLAVAHVDGERGAVLAAGHAQDVTYSRDHWPSFPGCGGFAPSISDSAASAPARRAPAHGRRRQPRRGGRLTVSRIRSRSAARSDSPRRRGAEATRSCSGRPRRATDSLSSGCPSAGPFGSTRRDSAPAERSRHVCEAHLELILVRIGPLRRRLVGELGEQRGQHVVRPERVIGSPAQRSS